jgi:predicted nucleic-acid-binding protein
VDTKGKPAAVIDTNLLVRYLTEDDPDKASAVESLLMRARRGEERLLVPSVVIAELVWVLESFYKIEVSKIAQLIDAILTTPGLEVQEDVLIRDAVTIYARSGVDFVDAWITAFAKQQQISHIYTFDKQHFKTTLGLKVTPP